MLATEFVWLEPPSAARPAHVRKMAWLMLKMAKAVPFVGYVLVCGYKPAKVA